MGANLVMCRGLWGGVPSEKDRDLFEIYTKYEINQAFFGFNVIHVR
jgi:hypothetical protein